MAALDGEIAETDVLIEGRFHDHPHAEVILSMPGLGPVLGAEFIAHTGGDMSVFGRSDRLAGVAGLAPVPKDSGWRPGAEGPPPNGTQGDHRGF
jgi:transposase